MNGDQTEQLGGGGVHDLFSWVESKVEIVIRDRKEIAMIVLSEGRAVEQSTDDQINKGIY